MIHVVYNLLLTWTLVPLSQSAVKSPDIRKTLYSPGNRNDGETYFRGLVRQDLKMNCMWQWGRGVRMTIKFIFWLNKWKVWKVIFLTENIFSITMDSSFYSRERLKMRGSVPKSQRAFLECGLRHEVFLKEKLLPHSWGTMLY